MSPRHETVTVPVTLSHGARPLATHVPVPCHVVISSPCPLTALNEQLILSPSTTPSLIPHYDTIISGPRLQHQ